MVDGSAEASLIGKIAGYTEILAKDPRSTVFVPLSETYRKLRMFDDAVEVASRGAKVLPTYAPGFVALARALAERGDWQGAAAAFDQTLAIEPANLQGLKGLARARIALRETEAVRGLLFQTELLEPALFGAVVVAGAQGSLDQSRFIQCGQCSFELPGDGGDAGVWRKKGQ